MLFYTSKWRIVVINLMFKLIHSTQNLCSATLFFRPSTFIAVYSHLEIRGESVGFVVGWLVIYKHIISIKIDRLKLFSVCQMKDKTHCCQLSSISAQFVLFSYLSDRTHLLNTDALNKQII